MTDELDDAMMHRALSLAQQAADLQEVPVGAVVYRGGEILGEAHNRRESDQDPTAHAEVIALRAAAATTGSWRLPECDIAVTLEPCPMCAGAMINARIRRLIYGAADPKMGSVDSLYQLCTDPRFNHRLQVRSGVLAEPCGNLLGKFFTRLRDRS